VSNWTGVLPDAVPPREPLFLISIPVLFWVVGGLVLVVALGCLLFDKLIFQIAGLAWLTTCLLVYRVGLFWDGAHTLGGYLGSVSCAFGISSAAAGTAADALLLGLFLGSGLSLLWLSCQRGPAMNDLKTACPACGGHIAFAPAQAGRPIACPHCGQPVVLHQSELLKMTCVLCGEHIEFPAHALGQKISCPHCQKTITLLQKS
jgi:DNA-directed RNA polymerase subunit RPC12/RpoP